MNISSPQPELQARLAIIEPYLNAIAIFIMATIFLFWDASRAVYVLLSLAALVFLVKYRPQMPRDHRLYSWPIIAYVGATVLSLLANDIPDGGVNRVTSRFLLLLIAIPLVSVFYLSFDPKRNIWMKYAIGCVVMGLLALVDILLLDKSRAGGGHNEVAFGCTALAMTSIVIASYYRFNQIRYGKAIFLLAILMGVCAMVLSGTRTSWVAGIVILLITMFFYLDRYSFFKRVLFTLVLMGVIAIVSSSLPRVQERFAEGIDMITPYLTGEEQTEYNAFSHRVEVWKLGWQAGLENKIFGFGPGNTKRVINEHARQNPQITRLQGINHIHNQFLQTFAMTGLVGLCSFLALIVCHLWIFTKYLRRQYSLEVRCLALAGLLLLVTYLVQSIPGVPFYGKQYLMMYGFASSTIWGCLLGALREAESATTRTGPI
jgi:O-antigen ligase